MVINIIKHLFCIVRFNVDMIILRLNLLMFMYDQFVNSTSALKYLYIYIYIKKYEYLLNTVNLLVFIVEQILLFKFYI